VKTEQYYSNNETIKQLGSRECSLEQDGLKWCLRLDRHPVLRPQHGPSVQPQQISRSIEPRRSFDKLQEEKPMDISKRIQQGV